MREPETLYVEPTNRCNLRCTTCPRTYFAQEPLKDMTLDEFSYILGQVPGAKRVVLHGLGEPLLNPHVSKMVALAKNQGRHVLFNSNALKLSEEISRALIAAGLDELRVSVDLPSPELYPTVRRGGALQAVYDNVTRLSEAKKVAGSDVPAVSFWMTEGKDRLGHLSQLVRDAAALEVKEVYLQRLILLDAGDAVPDNAVFGQGSSEVKTHFADAERVARELGVNLWGSGDANPASRGDGLASESWKACSRPFSATYITVHGNLLPCCLSPFTAAGRLKECVLGNIFEHPFEELWSGPAYVAFRAAFQSDEPPVSCASCGTLWSL